MIVKGGRAVVTDNSGGLICEVFGIYGGSKKMTANIGDLVRVAIKAAEPNKKVKKGEKYLGLVVCTKYAIKSFDGHVAKAGHNGIVLLTEAYAPICTRVFGFVSKRAFEKYKHIESIAQIASLCEEIY